ncbi:MAG: aminoglycoside phosphotransferase family protein [Pseudomonadota bacterium]
MLPPPGILRRFDLTAPEFVAETAIARVWKAYRNDAAYALKIYFDPGLANEAAGVELMRRWNGRHAARMIRRDGPAILLEWLDGPSLGDLAREGDDQGSARRLAAVAMGLRDLDIAPPFGALTLEQNASALLNLDLQAVDNTTLARNLGRAKDLAKELVGIGETALLHGDLHHDNIIAADRGDLVIDPKGLIAPPAFEFANAFRNPRAAPDLTSDPNRAQMLTRTFAEISGLSETELLRFAAMKAGLSICWTLREGSVTRESADSLSALMFSLTRT